MPNRSSTRSEGNVGQANVHRVCDSPAQDDALLADCAVWKPNRIRVLFVGESAPANGTHFYRGDSNLHRWTKESFLDCFGTEPVNDTGFLSFFRHKGCFLVDLCSSPVNGMEHVARRKARREGICGLTEVIRREKPEVMVVVMKGIQTHVRRALEKTGLVVDHFYVLPFPAMSHQHEYEEGLLAILTILRDAGLL